MENSSKIAKYLLLMVTVILGASACTKSRPLKFLDGDLRDGLVERSLVDGATYKAEVGSNESAKVFSGDQENWLAVNNNKSYELKTISAPNELKFMFDGLYLPANAGQSVELYLESDRNGVTAFMMVSSKEDLPLLYQQLATESSKRVGFFQVPVFYYNIKSFGVPTARKNALEEDLNAARLKQTDWDEATHIYLSPTATDRKPIGLVGNAQRDWERVFVASQLVDRVVSAGDLANYKIVTNLPDETNVVLKIQGNSLVIFLVVDEESDLLTATDRELISSGQESERVRSCNSVSSLSNQDSCVLLGRSRISISRVEADRNIIDLNGERGSSVVFRADSSVGEVGLIRIAERPVPEDVVPGDAWDPRYYLKVSSLVGKKFYFRRAIQDLPRQIPLFFVGEQGPMFLVEFVTQEGQLIVKKVDQGIAYSNPSTTDIEKLMSLSATYYRAEKTDSSGNALDIPRLVETSFSDSGDEVYVKVDWARSNIGLSGSMLGTEGFSDYCFRKGNDQRVESFDNRLSDERGVLNLTIDGTYSVNTSTAARCFGSRAGMASWASAWGGIESNFNIKERLSFYAHVEKDDDFKALDIPYSAQKAFGAGFISRPKQTPSEHGIGHLVENVSEQLLLHDFDGEEVEVWYLVGLPADYKYKKEVVDSTREVFQDLNDKFRRAFKGTPRETTRDHFEVRIVGVDTDEDVQVGDLDKNKIIYEARQTSNGFLGVYKGSGSPVSGKYITGNVVVFGGNTVSSLESQSWAARIRKKQRQIHDDLVASFAAQVEASPAPAGSGSVLQQPSVESQSLTPLLSPSLVGQGVGVELNNIISQKNIEIPFYKRANYSVDASLLKNNGLGAGLTDIIDVDSAQTKIQQFSVNGNVNVSSLLDEAFNQGKISEEQYSYTLFQRVYDGFIKEHGLSVALANPTLLERALMEEFIKAPPVAVSSSEMLSLQEDMAQLTFEANKLQTLNSSKTPHCFYTAPVLDDDIYDRLSFEEIFSNMYAQTLEHELLHNLGLEHQFEGSYDEKNFEFEGENVGRLSSGLMEYGGMGEKATWAGMGPHDVHAIRLAYTGMVELDKETADFILENSPGAIKLATGDIPVYDDKLVSIYDYKDKFFGDFFDWNELNEDAVRHFPFKVRHFEYCTNRDIGTDPTCIMFDKGTTVPEIVDDMINNHWQSYWVNNFAHDRYNFGVGYIFRNLYSSFYYFNQMRSFSDFLMSRLFLSGRGHGFENPQTYDDKLNAELFEASIVARNYMLAVIKTPDENPNGGGPQMSSSDAEFAPIQVELGYPDGSVGVQAAAIEYRNVSTTAYNDSRILRIGTYFSKLAAMETLTQKLSSRGGLQTMQLENVSQFSYLEFENFLMGVENPEESPILSMLTEYIVEDVSPMVLLGDQKNIPVQLNSANGVVNVPNSLAFTAAKAASLNIFSNAMIDNYNFAKHFRVYSVRGQMPEGLEGVSSVVDLAYDQDTVSQRRFFADGGEDSSIANKIIDGMNIYRVLLNKRSKVSTALSARIDSIINRSRAGSTTKLSDIGFEAQRQVLVEAMGEELGYSKERSEALLVTIDGFTEKAYPALLHSLMQGISTQNDELVAPVITLFQSLEKANPLLYGAYFLKVNEAIERGDEMVLGLPLNIARNLFSDRAFTTKYSSIKGNLEILNTLYSLIEPSARNR